MRSFISSRRGMLGTCTALVLVGAASIVGATPASAHMGIDLGGGTPTAGSSSVFWFRPGHGCNGDATNALVVTVPDGVTRVKAQPKSGWKLTSDGKTITWSHGSLPDDQFDHFGIRLTWPKLPAGVASQKFYFKSVQVCNAEIKVARSGDEATVTGYLPKHVGESVALFADGIPITIHDRTIGEDGRFTVTTASRNVPEGADVTAVSAGRVIGNSIAETEAWVEIPAAGSTATLASPAPSVTVVAPVAK